MDAYEKMELSLLNSVNTSTPNEDIHAFTEDAAPYVKNTGIERDGGITNLYETVVTYPDTGAHFVTEDGQVLTAIPNGLSRTIKVDDKIVGDVSAYGVEKRIQISGVDDCIVTADNTYVTTVVSGSKVYITEYDFNGTQLHQRYVTFTALASVGDFVTSLSIVRYNAMHYVDSFEFALRLGDQLVILKESTPGQTIQTLLQSTGVLGTSAIRAAVVYGTYLVVAGDNGRIGSYDGTGWKNYDGSGSGVGPYSNGTVVGTNTIYTLAVYGTSLVVGGTAGLIGSFDGVNWLAYNTAGTGLYNNATVIGTDNVTAMYVYTIGNTRHLIVGGSAGKLGSWDGTTWRLYNSAAGIRDNATLIGAGQINTITAYTEYEGYVTILVSGASGRVGSFKYQSGTTWVSGTMPTTEARLAPVEGNGVLVSSSNNNYSSNVICSSTDGLTWTARTLPFSSKWSKPVYANGLWVLVPAGQSSVSSNQVVTSMDGLTWTARTLPATQRWGWAVYGNGVWVIPPDCNTASNIAAYSTDGITWTAITLPATQRWAYSVTYIGGRWFLPPFEQDTGDIMATSADGINWTQVTLPLSTTWYHSPSYGRGTWIMKQVGVSTKVLVASIDGTTWTQVKLPTTQKWNVPLFIGGVWNIFPAYSEVSNQVAYSSDGYTWVGRVLPFVRTWDQPQYANGIWITHDLGSSNAAAYCVIGQAWTAATLPATQYWDTPVYHNGLWVMTGGTATAATSPDGITWTARTLPAAQTWSAPAYANGMWVITPYFYASTTAASSPDGLTWTSRTLPTSQAWSAPLYYNGLWVMFPDSNAVSAAIATTVPTQLTVAVYTATSTARYPTNNGTVVGANSITAAYSDPVSRRAVFCSATGLVGELNAVGIWTNYNATSVSQQKTGSFVIPNSDIAAIAFDGSTYVGITNTQLLYSSDGINWSVGEITGNPAITSWTDVIVGDQQFIALAFDSSIVVSDDGQTWTYLTKFGYHVYTDWHRLAYNPSNGAIVAIQVSATADWSIATSLDGGLSWEYKSLPSGPGGWLTDITCSNDTFVIVIRVSSTTSCIASSPDGVTWSYNNTLSVAPGGTGWKAVTWGNGTFVAVAESTGTTNVLATSPDGATWTFRTITAPSAIPGWADVDFCVDRFVAVAGSTSETAAMMTSPDGITWTYMTTSHVGYWNRICNLGNKLVILATVATVSATSTIENAFSFGIPIINNATALGAVSINAVILFGSQVIIGGASGRLASFNGTYWKNYDGTGNGNGPYANGNLVGANAIYAFCIYNTKLIVGAAAGVVGSINANYSLNLLYTTAGGVAVSNLLTGQSTNAYLYVYKYENGIYLVNLVGNSLCRSYTLNDTTKVISILNASYAIPQVSNSLSRHILTTSLPDYTTVAGTLRATGLVGYTDFINWSADAIYPTATYTLGNGNVLSAVAGFGYSDFTFRTTASATNIFNYYSPQFTITPQGQYNVVQSNTNTLINAYGKLNATYGLPSSKPFGFRVGFIPTAAGTSGQMSYLSVALTDTLTTDILGVLITNVGEFDATYEPMINVDENSILYKYNGNFYIVKISTVPTDILQNVGDGLYKINTISPLNLLYAPTKTLYVGSSDYNGRMVFSSVATPGVSSKIASTQSSEYSNSIDVGDKLITINPVAASNFEVIGYRVPNVTTLQNYTIDTFVDDEYFDSTFNDGSELAVVTKVDTIYTNTPTTPKIVPVAIGQTYANQTIVGNNQTIILEQNNPTTLAPYDGYRIGNKLVGEFVLFSLNNGYKYLFDGRAIYSATISTSGFVSNKVYLAPATGLKFVALAPTTAYFVSGFDNSLYTFSGGQSLVKAKRMNRLDTITDGIYNTRDNTLLLQSATELVWIRDSVLTVNKKQQSLGTDLKLYSTDKGIILGNDVQQWQFTFFNQTGAVVMPLEWQSAYYGRTLNQKSILSEIVYTIYDETKSRHKITGYVYTRDPDTATTQRREWDILPNMYTDGGYVTLRLKPETAKSLGTSFGLTCNDKITILDAVVVFTNDVNAVVTETRSR